MTFTRTLTLTLAAGIMACSIAACNTVEGAGQDISNGGKSIARAADSTKEKMNENNNHDTTYHRE